jgi:methyl-accepting chemotaxis protein
MPAALPTAAAFRRGVIGLSFSVSGPALAIVLGVLLSLLELTGEQWAWFFGVTALYALAATPIMAAYQWRMLAPVTAWLEGEHERAAASEDSEPQAREGAAGWEARGEPQASEGAAGWEARGEPQASEGAAGWEARGEPQASEGSPAPAAAFARVVDLPRRAALVGAVGWVVPVVAIAAAMELRWPQWGGFETGVLLASGVAAGFVAGSFMILLVKRRATPVRRALAEALPDPAEREALVRPLGLRAKLLVSVVGVTVVSAVFSVLLAHATALRAIHRVAIQWEGELLGVARGGGPGASRHGLAGAFAGALRVAEVDLAAAADQGLLEPQVVAHLRREIAQGASAGDSEGLPTHAVFAWRRAGPDPERVALAILPRDALAIDVTRTGTLFGLLLLVATGVAVGLSWLLAGDVSRATEALRREARRLASGDLRRGRIWESEDELGLLWRSFEAMAGSLRETVGRVALAADRVEGTAGAMVEVAASVLAVSADQVRGIQQATASMEAINAQVRGIADSSAALNVSVEESSSSVLELGAAGEQLRATAGVLLGRVNEVGASIEQMVHSVREVVGSTESLGAAAEETSASMGEMAQSLREVDASAEQTARLSREVVESAEAGQGTLGRTLAGMEAIRAATEAAEGVVRTLGSRTREIGAIVDVIDEVADETNLLALNAAIIAAQAGEQGRAFSVVAEEIKDLADRVLSSTKEIGGLIRSVQAEGAAAIGAIERGARSVAEGSQLWAAAGSSWAAITKASRESGERMAGIVLSVREQARAAGRVVELMERVREGVEAIRRAAAEQDRGNAVISRSALSMREVAAQVRGTTEEQARGSGRIRESVEGVREAVERINQSLQEQSAACRSAVEFLEAVWRRTQSNEQSAGRLDAVARGLVAQAEGLRQHVERFRIE